VAVVGVPAEHERMAYIIRNLRPIDREELFAVRWDDDEDKFLDYIMAYAGAMTVVWERDGLPVSAQGVVPLRPGVVELWCFGTMRWSSVLLSMTKHAKRFIVPALARAGIHRAEAHPLVSNLLARHWIERMGGRLESIQRGAGRSGEDYATYVWQPNVFLWRSQKQRPSAGGRI
jgi:uncharacterized protein (DUF2237 family)